jgi:hypothetical protein
VEVEVGRWKLAFLYAYNKLNANCMFRNVLPSCDASEVKVIAIM